MEGEKKQPAAAAAFSAEVNVVLHKLQQALAAVATATPASQLMQGLNDQHVAVLTHWVAICAGSETGMQPLLHALGVAVTERGESTYMHMLPDVVHALQRSGAARESDGAIAMFVDGDSKPPFLLRKRDGSYLYSTIDMATLWTRLSAGYERIIYVTDVAQAQHFKQLFQAARVAGWIDAAGNNKLHSPHRPVRLEHASFGVVTGDNGKRLSSRDGTTLTLASLLEEGERTVMAMQTERATADAAGLARVMAANAVRYFELSHSRGKDYAFSYDRALNMKGNTAVYLMYASTRLSSLRGRVCEHVGLRSDAGWDTIAASLPLPQPAATMHASERRLALTVVRVGDAFHAACDSLQPHLLAEALYDVTNDFHTFYETCRILPQDKGEAVHVHRVQLCGHVDALLAAGLGLLGVRTLSRM